MTYFTSLSKESVKGLGSGAYLVNILPSAVLIISVFALVASHLYPWMSQRVVGGVDGGPAVEKGLPSIIDTVASLNVAGAVVFGVLVLVGGVLISPFQIALVQLLEGYWSNRLGAFTESLAIERHRRRRSIALWRSDREDVRVERALDTSFAEVAAYARRSARGARRQADADDVLAAYPRKQDHILPTRLGNILRRAETTAGERYGLDTVATYPRLYPQLSSRLDAEMSAELNALDAGAALTLVLGLLTAVSIPLIGQEWWSLVPIGFAAGSVLAHRGTRRAAERQAILLCTAYDLHRFGMLDALHRALPRTPGEERELNNELSIFLADREEQQGLPALTHPYLHPVPSGSPPVSTEAGRPPGPDRGGGSDDSEEAAEADDGEDPGGSDSRSPNTDPPAQP